MTTRLDVADRHRQIVLKILREIIPQRTVLAFGSRIKGAAKKYSDLDLAIMGDGPLSLDTSARLRTAFSESDLPWKVDFVDFASISHEFRDIILSDHVVLVA